MSWDATAGGGGFDNNAGDNSFGNSGAAPINSGDARNYEGSGDFGDNGEDAGDGTCFNCGEQGHMKNECPEPRKGGENSGLCYKCGETGHNKADCTNPVVVREFTGECRLCGETGHRASDCPAAPPVACKNCGQEGHLAVECNNPRPVDRSHVLDVSGEHAWSALCTAVDDKDIDDFKIALDQYLKATKEITYLDLEKSFRSQELDVWVIALERDTGDTFTHMDLQGNLEKKYCISYRFSDRPRRPKEKEGWPASADENLERLKDAGEPVDRRVPRCRNCNEMGHAASACPEEKNENTDRVEVKCFNCDEVGHRVRDCPNPRPDRFACRNCGKSGHSSKECPDPPVDRPDMECRKCGEMGHSSRTCPQGGGGGSRACRNCGQEGHRAAECVNEHVDVCRNCDAIGHISKECDKPKDWSRVKCSNCQQFGHGKARCKEPIAEEGGGESGGFGGDAAATGDDGFGSAEVVAADAGGDSWGGGGGGGGGGGDW